MEDTVSLRTMKTATLDGITYTLNQCDDIWKWFDESKVGEFTRFYSKIVFHKKDGFYAAYFDDWTNGCYV